MSNMHIGVTASTDRVVAALLSAAGAAVLAVRAARTLSSPQGSGENLMPGMGTTAVAALGLVTALVALLGHRLAGVAATAALGGALVVEVGGAAPPRLLPLLPLSLAAGLLLVSGYAGRPSRLGADPAGAAATTGRPRFRQALGWLALALHAVVGLLYLVSGLVAPMYGVAGLWLLWTALLAVLLRLRLTRPVWALAVPVGAVALWYAVLYVGETAWGWTA